ncbi:MAG: hypothetical protein Fur0039_02220 [Rhodocyclaceae bacterium]
MLSSGQTGAMAFVRYWAKADPSYPGEPKWHPLGYHCLDVAACGLALLDAEPGRLAPIARIASMPEDDLRRWLVLLLAHHDIGKFGNGFQVLRPDPCLALHGRTPPSYGGVRHDTLGYELGMAHLPGWLERPELAARGGALLRPWLAPVTGHHGRPPRSLDDGALLLQKHFPERVLADAKHFVLAARHLLLPEGVRIPEAQPGLADRLWKASWLTAGLAVVADWLGSNTRWFPYRKPDLPLEEYWRVAVDCVADECAVLGRMEAALDRGRCAVWIRNTVADAVDAWRRWNDAHPGRPAVLFHARFACLSLRRISTSMTNSPMRRLTSSSCFSTGSFCALRASFAGAQDRPAGVLRPSAWSRCQRPTSIPASARSRHCPGRYIGTASSRDRASTDSPRKRRSTTCFFLPADQRLTSAAALGALPVALRAPSGAPSATPPTSLSFSISRSFLRHVYLPQFRVQKNCGRGKRCGTVLSEALYCVPRARVDEPCSG